MGGKKRDNYIQTAQNRLYYVVAGVLACVVVGGILGYVYLSPHPGGREVVRPVEQEIPTRIAARQPVPAEEPEAQPAVSPQPLEQEGELAPEEEEPGTVGEIGEPYEEAQETPVAPLDEMAVSDEEMLGESLPAEDWQVEEESLPPEPAGELAAPPEEGVPASEVGSEEAVAPSAVAEGLTPEVEPSQELVTGGAPVAEEVTEAPEARVEEGPPERGEAVEELAQAPVTAAEEVPPEVEGPVGVAALEAPAPPEAVTVEPKEMHYALHVASYQSEEQGIKDAVARLRLEQQSAVIPVAIPGKGLWFRVLVGRFATLEEASEQSARLKEEGYEYVAPMELPYLIEVSTFQTLTVAGFEEEKLRKEGYASLILPFTGEDGSVRYKVCVGVFDALEDAQTVSRQMQEKGIVNTVFRP